jgi:hypothetical protein
MPAYQKLSSVKAPSEADKNDRIEADAQVGQPSAADMNKKPVKPDPDKRTPEETPLFERRFPATERPLYQKVIKRTGIAIPEMKNAPSQAALSLAGKVAKTVELTGPTPTPTPTPLPTPTPTPAPSGNQLKPTAIPQATPSATPSTGSAKPSTGSGIQNPFSPGYQPLNPNSKLTNGLLLGSLGLLAGGLLGGKNRLPLALLLALGGFGAGYGGQGLAQKYLLPKIEEERRKRITQGVDKAYKPIDAVNKFLPFPLNFFGAAASKTKPLVEAATDRFIVPPAEELMQNATNQDIWNLAKQRFQTPQTP